MRKFLKGGFFEGFFNKGSFWAVSKLYDVCSCVERVWLCVGEEMFVCDVRV